MHLIFCVCVLSYTTGHVTIWRGPCFPCSCWTNWTQMAYHSSNCPLNYGWMQPDTLELLGNNIIIYLTERFSLERWKVLICCYPSWLANFPSLLDPFRSTVKRKLVMAHWHKFSHVTRQLLVFTMSFDWFIALSVHRLWRCLLWFRDWLPWFWFHDT